MVDAVTTNAAAGRINSGGAMLASNFETFLSLLTAQLKNQDPLSPVDSNQFTAQLTQMAGVEQQLLTNDLLTSLLAQNSGGLGGATDFIGKEITAAWSAARLEDGAATWSYELAANATSAKVEVLDGSGRVVFTGDAADLGTGVHDFTWDGRTNAGGQAVDGGVYSLRVTARNATGQTIDSQVLMRGRVTGVEMYDGQPYLTIGGSVLPMSSVIAVDEIAAQQPVEEEEDPGVMAALFDGLNPFN